MTPEIPPQPSASTLPRTALCDMLGCRHPIVLAGMGGVARAGLVGAVSQAGGFGFLGMVREPLALIREQMAAVRALTPARFGVNLIPSATDGELLAQQLALCIELKVPVVGLFWDVAADVIAQLRAADILVVHQVGSLEQALAAQAAGAQALIVQGVEAGGHVAGRQPLARLLAQVLPNVDIPVAAAGGLADGADVARVLAQGAQAAVLGTALLATQESFAHAYHKQRVVDAKAGDTVLTEDFHLNWPPHAAVRVLRNSVTEGRHGDPHTQARQAIGEEAGRPIHLFSTDSPLSSMTGDFEAMALYAGLGVGRIHDLPPAGERVAQLLAQARAAWPVAQNQAERERTRQAALIERLNELLEAERAGVRVAAHALDQAPDAKTRALLDLIHRDEVRWCVMLRGAIRQLHGRPSTHTGDFHRKAIAIEDLNERLAFLNRGQGWVAKKLRELLPEVNDPVLSDDLARMLAAHRENLDRVNEHLAH